MLHRIHTAWIRLPASLAASNLSRSLFITISIICPPHLHTLYNHHKEKKCSLDFLPCSHPSIPGCMRQNPFQPSEHPGTYKKGGQGISHPRHIQKTHVSIRNIASPTAVMVTSNIIDPTPLIPSVCFPWQSNLQTQSFFHIHLSPVPLCKGCLKPMPGSPLQPLHGLRFGVELLIDFNVACHGTGNQARTIPVFSSYWLSGISSGGLPGRIRFNFSASSHKLKLRTGLAPSWSFWKYQMKLSSLLSGPPLHIPCLYRITLQESSSMCPSFHFRPFQAPLFTTWGSFAQYRRSGTQHPYRPLPLLY